MTPLTLDGTWHLFAFGLRAGVVLVGLVLPTAALALAFWFRWELFCCFLAVAYRVAGLFRLSPERELARRVRRLPAWSSTTASSAPGTGSAVRGR